jgi:hypothetical protein
MGHVAPSGQETWPDLQLDTDILVAISGRQGQRF